MHGLNDISEVEKLKLLKAIRVGCKSDEDFNTYLSMFCNPDEVDEFKRRVQGYFYEDEFFVICHLMNACKRITPLGQTPLPNMEKGTPDYLVTFDTPLGDFSCFVEVKTTEKMEAQPFSKNATERVKKYADTYCLPLFFASRIIIGDCGVWVLQTYDEFLENQRKAVLGNITDVVGTLLMKEMFLSVVKEFSMEMTFKEQGSGVRYDKYGFLTGMNVSVGDICYCFDDVSELDILFSIFAKEDYSIKTSSGYKLFKTAKKNTSLPLSSVLLHLNTVLCDDDGVKSFSNSSRLIAQIEFNKGVVFTLDRLNQMIMAIDGTFRRKNSIFGYLALGDESTHKMLRNTLGKMIKKQRAMSKVFLGK